MTTALEKRVEELHTAIREVAELFKANADSVPCDCYNGRSIGQRLDEPASTVDTTDRLSLVTVAIEDTTYVIADILMRMLEPRELFRASDFDDDYIIDPIYNGKPLTRTSQVRMCGNAVPPAPVCALVGAQFPEAA